MHKFDRDGSLSRQSLAARQIDFQIGTAIILAVLTALVWSL
jgi:hypothetical protein